MLQFTIPETEIFNEAEGTIEYTKPCTIQLEHSLLSISKWEAKYHIPFLDNKERTDQQLLDYIKFMTITKNVPDIVYQCLTRENVSEINAYIEDPMTATTVKATGRKGEKRMVTNELIYYWMVELGIPFECERWHLARLLMLITVCNEENKPKKKMPMKDYAKYRHSLNSSRRAKHGSLG